MKTAWDYTALAEAYLKRPDYADSAIDAMLTPMNLPAGAAVCDVGAGVAHLTLMLAQRGYNLTAVEPNDNMRALGQKRTAELSASLPDIQPVSWYEGTGELSGQPDSTFSLVTFGSSFNVTDRQKALIETARILQPEGWFACMWNHRDLKDPLQAALEAEIRRLIPDYGYGTRREDQTRPIRDSGLFGEISFVSGRIIHQQSLADCMIAWRSHATLLRQAGERFDTVIQALEDILKAQGSDIIEIPYDTRVWFARKLP